MEELFSGTSALGDIRLVWLLPGGELLGEVLLLSMTETALWPKREADENILGMIEGGKFAAWDDDL